MEKLEYQIVRDFIIDLGNSLEDKIPNIFKFKRVRV